MENRKTIFHLRAIPRWTAPSLALMGLAALIPLAGCGAKEHPSHPLPEPPAAKASTVTLKLEEVPTLYEASGQVRSVLASSLAAKVMGRVESVLVREGDRVSPGQVLIRLDSRELSSGLDVARASLQAAKAGVATASTAAQMEDKMSQARIEQAEASLAQAKAVAQAAQASLDLALAGPRSQQKTQAQVAVDQAASTLRLAEIELARTKRLVEDGAMAPRQLDLAQNAYDLAKGQHQAALQSLSIAQEGSRDQEIRSAREQLRQAQAAVRQAEAGVSQAKAASLQKGLRRQEVNSAKAMAAQSAASLRSAQTLLGHSVITAPFAGVVVKRMADPGTMASPGVPLIEIEGGGLRLEALMPESLLPKIPVGAVAMARLDAVSESAVPAKVAEIVPRGDASTHTFLVKFDLPQGQGIKSGMFGRVMAPTGKARKLMILPTDTWRKEGLDYVYAVNSEGIIRLRVITLGRPQGGRIEVLSGLNPGDRIVTGDKTGVADGARLLGEGQ